MEPPFLFVAAGCHCAGVIFCPESGSARARGIPRPQQDVMVEITMQLRSSQPSTTCPSANPCLENSQVERPQSTRESSVFPLVNPNVAPV